MNEVGSAQAVIGSFIIRLADLFEIAVVQAANEELVQMIVPPAKGRRMTSCNWS